MRIQIGTEVHSVEVGKPIMLEFASPAIDFSVSGMSPARVKIGDRWYGETEWDDLLLTEQDVQNIQNMAPGATRYARFEEADRDGIEAWMNEGSRTDENPFFRIRISIHLPGRPEAEVYGGHIPLEEIKSFRNLDEFLDATLSKISRPIRHFFRTQSHTGKGDRHDA